MTEIKSTTLKCAPANIDVICINGKLSIEGQGHLPHELCQGTGYRFPTLWTECEGAPYRSNHDWCCKGGMLQWNHSPGVLEEVPCPNCTGTGWIPSVTEGKLLEILKGLIGAFTITRRQYSLHIGLHRVGITKIGEELANCDTLLEALDAAIMATVFSPQ